MAAPPTSPRLYRPVPPPRPTMSKLQCAPETLDERPFFLPVPVPAVRELSREKSVYVDLIKEALSSDTKFVATKSEGVARCIMDAKQVIARKDSSRLQSIMENNEEPDWKDIFNFQGSEDENLQAIYGYAVTRKVKPKFSLANLEPQAVEITLYEIFQTGKNRCYNTWKDCPLNLGGNRVRLVMRLEIDQQWKDFASRIFRNKLLNDDMNLIEEVGFKYGPPSVEIFLLHWERVYKANVYPDLPPPCKQTIRNTLDEMDRLDLLQDL